MAQIQSNIQQLLKDQMVYYDMETLPKEHGLIRLI